MVVYYDEESFSIKLYRDCVKGELVDLIEVISIDELLEVWQKHKADTPQTESCYKKEDVVRVVENVKRGYGLTKSAEDIVAEMQTDCGWK